MIVGILKLSINTSICPIWAHWIIFPSHKFGRPFINHIVSAPNKANLIHQPNKELRRRDRFFQGYIFLFCYKSQDAHFHFTETFKQTCFINKEKNHKKGRQFFFLLILDGGLPKMVICLGLFGFWYFKKKKWNCKPLSAIYFWSFQLARGKEGSTPHICQHWLKFAHKKIYS